MPEILPAHSPEVPEGHVFISQIEADFEALVKAAGDRVAELITRPGWGITVPADIAKAAGAKGAKAVPAETVPEPEPESKDSK